MAKIVLSDVAPQGEALTFSLGNAEPFEAPFETTDATILANANAHPWLIVEQDERDSIDIPHPDRLAPEDDALSAQNSVANDPDAVRAALQEQDDDSPLAIEAGRDQDTPEFVGNVGITLAADDDADNDDDGEGN